MTALELEPRQQRRLQGAVWRALAVLSLCGCFDPLQMTFDAGDVECLGLCADERVAYAPEPGLQDVAAEALARFSAATGRHDLRVSESGIPIVLGQALYSRDEQGKPQLGPSGMPEHACGVTAFEVFEGTESPHPYALQVTLDPSPPAGCPEPDDGSAARVGALLQPAR